MAALLPLVLLSACGPHFEDFHEVDMEVEFTTDAGRSASTSGPWTVTEAEYDGLEPRGVTEIAGDLYSRFHESPATGDVEFIQTRFGFGEMFRYGASQVVIEVAPVDLVDEVPTGPIGAWTIPVEGVDVDYSSKHGFSWTFTYDTDINGLQWGQYTFETVTESKLTGQTTIGADCSPRAAIDACGVFGAPAPYCGARYDDEGMQRTLTADPGTCPEALVSAFVATGAVFDNQSFHRSMDLGGAEPLKCDKSNFCGFSQCYAEEEVEVDGCTWRAQALGFSSSGGTILGLPDDSCELDPCVASYTSVPEVSGG